MGEHLQSKVELTAALRWAAQCGLNEGVCNHFSMEVAPDRYLINPQGLHWTEVCVSDILLINGEGQVLQGRHALEPSAFFIHCWIQSELYFASIQRLLDRGQHGWRSSGIHAAHCGIRPWERPGGAHDTGAWAAAITRPPLAATRWLAPG